MAFGKTAFDKYGVFRSDLGKSGKNLMANEESEFCGRFLVAGEKIVYSPKAIVYHLLDSTQETKGYYLTRSFNHAKSYVRMQYVPITHTRRFRVPIKGGILELSANTIRWLFTIDTPIRFFHKIRVYSSLGTLIGYFNILRKK